MTARTLASTLVAMMVAGGAACRRGGSTGMPTVDWLSVPPQAGPIGVADNRRYLVDHAGRPFFLHGEAAWSLISATKREDVELYLSDRRARGFNAISVVLIDHLEPPTNAYGDAPFSVRGDFATPNEAYFAYADWVVRRAAEKGFIVLLSPCYLGYEGGQEGFYQDVLRNGESKMRGWGSWVGARYRDFSNIIWLNGGDYNPPPEGIALLNAVVAGIKAEDDRHIHAVHWGPETSGSEIEVPWLDLNTTYTYKPVYLKALLDHTDASRPFILLESTYENEHGASTQLLRAQAYYAVLSGASGHVFGSFPVWKFASNWQEELASNGALSMSHVRSLFADRSWFTLQPDTASQVLTGGSGTKGSTDYALLAMTQDRHLAIAYLPSRRAVTVDMRQLAGRARVSWYDPSNGTWAAIEGSPFASSTPLTFTPPQQNAAGDGDWVLVLDVAP